MLSINGPSRLATPGWGENGSHKEGMKLKIKNIKVLERTEDTTDIEVVANYHNYDYTVRTTIREGRDQPTATLVGYTVPPSDEFVNVLHAALDEQHGDFVAMELERICG